MARSFVILAIVITMLALSGCLFSSGRPDASPTLAATGTPQPPGTMPTPTPTPTPMPFPSFSVSPGATWAWTPGTDGALNNYTQLFPTPGPGANETNQTASPTPTAQPIVSARANDWGTSKDAYNRGDTANGWVYVTNTGNVPINTIDFTMVIKKTIFFFPVEKSYDYSKTGLNIQPGETQRVEFSQSIPAEYSGVSTAGDYQFKVTAKLAGTEIGSYSKGMKVV